MPAMLPYNSDSCSAERSTVVKREAAHSIAIIASNIGGQVIGGCRDAARNLQCARYGARREILESGETRISSGSQIVVVVSEFA